MKKNGWIKVIGAREHNLKNIDVSIPKDQLTVVTGPSGSGKSSLALNILFTEGKRRYMESLSSYARQFLGIPKKPDVDSIEGLCPSIAIEQKTVGSNPRSTVGTITEIYDYLRVLFARIGTIHCPECKNPISAQSPKVITHLLLEKFSGQYITVVAPLAHEKKGEFVDELTTLFNEGFYRFLIDGKSYKFKSVDDITELKLKKTYKHTIDLVIDAIEVVDDEQSRLQEALEKAFAHANGSCKIVIGEKTYKYSSHQMCIDCGASVPELEPRLFSFNSPIGACPHCHGLGITHTWPWKEGEEGSWKAEYLEFFSNRYAQESTCKQCMGQRLNKQAIAVTIGKKNIFELGSFSIKLLLQFFEQLKLAQLQQEIAHTLIQEIVNRLRFLSDVGLSYLTLNRTARTLSGGEGQRIRLATQIGSALSGVLYILDEPSVGLHQRDNDKLITMLKKLRDLGNTVVVVEHDMDTIAQADYLIDMGPAAGLLGGRVTAVGSPSQVAKNPESLTGSYLSGKRSIPVPKKLRKPTASMTLHHANKNNLRDISVPFPLGALCCVTGVSGSGKSTLVMQELVPALHTQLGGYARKHKKIIQPTDSDLEGAESIENLVVIDQTPIGRTPRSNPSTYLGIFDEIRKLFASLPESNARGYIQGRFSFNVAQGRCFACKGEGTVTIEMHFLPAVTMICKTCKGKRYNAETLQILYKGKSIADVLNLSAREALEFFASFSSIAKRLQLVCDVGLDYLTLGQPSTTLSGGEAQRIKLVDELAKRGHSTLYILDEPTTGLHTHDIERLLIVLNRLIDKGNSVLVIEHNLDLIKTADYILDLGPDGGDEGGYLVAQGTPAQVAKNEKSHTGNYLKKLL